MDYDIPAFRNDKGYNRFRSCYVLKNSYGVDDIGFGYNFIGECGAMNELPKASEIKDYDQYANLKCKTIK